MLSQLTQTSLFQGRAEACHQRTSARKENGTKMSETHALVLGGGGVAGIAWMTGLLAGLADAGQDAVGADVGIGTSAGAHVAAPLGGGLSLDELFARQVDPALQSRELMAEIDWAKFAADLEPYMAGASTQ